MTPDHFSVSAILVLSAFLHAAWNTLIKQSKDKNVALLWVVMIAASGTGLVTLVKSETSLGSDHGFWFSLLSGLCEGGYFFTLGKTLKKLPLGIAYSVMRGFAMILVWIISLSFQEEHFSAITGLGAGLVMVGLLLIHSLRGMKTLDGKNILWAYGCGIFIAGYHLSYGIALKHGAQPMALFSVALWIATPLLILGLTRGQKKTILPTLRTSFKSIVFAGLVCALSFVLFLSALGHSGAGLAITLRNSSIAFAQIFGILIGERITAKQWVGVGVVILGASLLSLG